MKHILLLIFIITLCTNTWSQELKLSGLSYLNYGKASVKNSTDNSEVSFEEEGFFVNFPKQLKNKRSVLINGGRYARVKSTLYENENVINETTFQSISYTLGLIHKFKKDWTCIVMLSPTLASDFKSKISHDDFVFQGHATINKTTGKNILIGGGLAYSTSLGIPLPFPVFQLRYEDNYKSIKLFLPLMAEYLHIISANTRLEGGFRYAINGAYFNYSADNTEDSTNTINKLRYTRANVGPVINYRIGKILQLEAFGGMSSFRKYRLMNEQDDKLKFDSKASAFINFNINLLIPESGAKRENH